MKLKNFVWNKRILINQGSNRTVAEILLLVCCCKHQTATGIDKFVSQCGIRSPTRTIMVSNYSPKLWGQKYWISQPFEKNGSEWTKNPSVGLLHFLVKKCGIFTPNPHFINT